MSESRRKLGLRVIRALAGIGVVVGCGLALMLGEVGLQSEFMLREAYRGMSKGELLTELLTNHRLGLGLIVVFSLGALWLSFQGPPDQADPDDRDNNGAEEPVEAAAAVEPAAVEPADAEQQLTDDAEQQLTDGEASANQPLSKGEADEQSPEPVEPPDEVSA